MLGIEEGEEGLWPTEFIAQLLQDVLQLEDKPVLGRAHCSIRAKPKDGELPRPFVIRVHFSRSGNLYFARPSRQEALSDTVETGSPSFLILLWLWKRNVQHLGVLRRYADSAKSYAPCPSKCYIIQ